MKNARVLKDKIRGGVLTLGSWITLAHPAIAEIMSAAKFDWIAIDMEHSVITLREMEELIRVIDLSGVAPLVRLTSNDENQIKRVMDAGAHGVIVPMVCSQKEVEEAVSAVYYPIKGARSIGLARAQGYGAKFRDYVQWLSENAVVIVQIEHIRAVENLSSILSVDCVDGYIIGPYDLSASMGMPGEFDNPEVISAIEEVRRIGMEIGKSGGVHIVEPNPEALKECIDSGFKFIAYSVDIRMLDVSCRVGLSLAGIER